MKKILLSVAGFDPTSGAGVSLDLKVFQHLGFQGMGILTSLTSQNTTCIKSIHCPSPRFLWNQYQTLCEDVAFSGIKVGMIGSKKNIQVINRMLSDNPDIPKVVDPVFKSSSGIWLLEKEAIPTYIHEISEKVSLLTPNLEEAVMISGVNIKNLEDMKEAAKRIYSLTRIPCLIKGGHLQKRTIDLLYDNNKFHFFRKEKLERKVHGTGCFFSSSLLGYLVKSNSIQKAFEQASQLTYVAIKNAIQIGRGQAIITFPFD